MSHEQCRQIKIGHGLVKRIRLTPDDIGTETVDVELVLDESRPRGSKRLVIGSGSGTLYWKPDSDTEGVDEWPEKERPEKISTSGALPMRGLSSALDARRSSRP